MSSHLPLPLPLHRSQGNVFQDAVFNQTVTVTEREDGLDGETYVMDLCHFFSRYSSFGVGTQTKAFICTQKSINLRVQAINK